MLYYMIEPLQCLPLFGLRNRIGRNNFFSANNLYVLLKALTTRSRSLYHFHLGVYAFTLCMPVAVNMFQLLRSQQQPEYENWVIAHGPMFLGPFLLTYRRYQQTATIAYPESS